VRIEQTLKYMEPVEYGDGHGFRTVVRTDRGGHYLISEVHRERVDEVMVFPCSEAGEITDWGEVYGIREGTTEGAIRAISRWVNNERD